MRGGAFNPPTQGNNYVMKFVAELVGIVPLCGMAHVYPCVWKETIVYCTFMLTMCISLFCGASSQWGVMLLHVCVLTG